MKKVLSILAICLAAVMMLSLAACGNNTDTDPTEAAEATAATTAQTVAPTQNADNAADNSVDNTASGSSDTTDTDNDWYNNEETQRSMAQQKVVQRAVELYGDGEWHVESTEKSADSNGNPYWYIGVSNYSKAQSPIYYFYCNPGFYCYPDDSNPSSDSDNIMNDTSFAGISEPDACAKALQAIGEGNWNLVSCIQSEYEGVDAWAVTVTNPDVGLTMLAFVGGDFCYFK